MITVTTKFAISSTEIYDINPEFLKVFIYTKNYNRRSRIFHEKL